MKTDKPNETYPVDEGQREKYQKKEKKDVYRENPKPKNLWQKIKNFFN
ncbi:hypothetical protein [Mesonia aquimarina]|nr:hypothetical protein [Mesonia aquimarina]